MPRRTSSDKVLRDKAFNIAKNSKYDGYQYGQLCQWFIFFFNKKSFIGSVTRAQLETLAVQDKSAIKSESTVNKHPLNLAT